MQLRFNNWEKYNIRTSGIKQPFWFSFNNQFFADPFIFDLNNDEKVVFIFMLCEASQSNENGRFGLSVQKAGLFTGLTTQFVCSMVDKLLESGKISKARTGRVRDADGTRTAQTNKQTNKHIVQSEDRTKNSDFVGSIPMGELEAIYNAYPQRNGTHHKATGFKKLTAIAKNNELNIAKVAVDNYAAYCKKENKVGTQFVKMFSSFFDSDGNWKEWANSEQVKKESSRRKFGDV